MRRVLFWQYWHKRDYNRLGSALTPPSNSGVLMQIVLRGAAAGYEAEHTARIFYPAAELSQTLPDDTADLVLAVAHRYLLLVLVRQNGTTTWMQQRPPQGDARTQEYALCRMLYTMLCGVTGIRPPWGMMTGVRPVRIIHDLRAEGKTEEEIEQRFLQHFDCTPRRFAMAKSIADLQRPVLERAQPMDCSVYAGIPFCPSRCSYCSFVSRTVGDKSSRALVAPYVDCLCKELAATRAAADAAHLSIKTLYIGGGTPTSVNAQQLRQLMGTMAEQFDLPALEEFTVEAGRPDCTDEEKLRIIKEYGATRISINPQTFSDEVLRNIGRRHTAQDILDCYRTARRVGHDNINMDLIAGLPGDTVEGFRHSLQTAIDLDPENITVHTLTLKRRPTWWWSTALRIMPMWPLWWKAASCWKKPVTAPTTCTAKKAPCKTWKTWAGASRGTSACIISISWRKSTPFFLPVRAVLQSWWPPVHVTARSSVSLIISTRQNISTVLTRSLHARKE